MSPGANVPLGAQKLGCRGCVVGQWERFPEMRRVYCATCPVTLRRQDGKPWVIRRYEREG